ncbi:putative Ig domain-containing protein [Paracidovorax valerianellae]|nr:putative Ig domain-containing protein [Paracidovorax valerianellae]
MLQSALREIDAIAKEAVRVTTLVAGGTGEGASARPKEVTAQDIAGLDLNYRLAMQIAGQHTRSASLAAGAGQGFGDKQYGGQLANQYDVVGDTSPSVVSNSQWHYGQDVRIGIEDQPLYRGGIGGGILMDAIALKSPDLLVDQYALRDFGDTHSLVLLVDSLSLQNTLLSLVPPEQRTQESAKELFKALYQAATDKKRVDGDLLAGAGQGKAEGDLLENLVNVLADTVLGTQAKADRLKGNTEGGTWALTQDEDGYSGRDRFYAVLEKVQKGIEDLKLDKPFALASTGAATALIRSARSDFGDFLALQTLSPFALHMADAQAGQDAIGARWGAAYTDWKSDQQALAAGQSTADLRISDQWLTDRAGLLERKNAFGIANLNSFDLTPIPEQGPRATAPYHLEDTYYEDANSGYKVRQGATTNATRNVYFGDGEDNQFVGRALEDHLYGGAGNDTLDGKGGGDYLEGGAGKDVYRFNGQFGNDTVWDADGSGTLEFDGVAMPLAVLRRYGTDDAWEDASGQFLFTRIPQGKGSGDRVDVRITKYTSATDKTVQGTVTVRNYRAGAFGLTLGQEQEVVPMLGGAKTSLVVRAGNSSDPTIAAAADVPRLYESAASLQYEGTDDAAKWVYANDSDGGQIVQTGAGDDRIFVGRVYESTVQPGAENWAPRPDEDEDHVVAGAGNDVVLTGYGSDTIEGGDGDDQLFSAMVGSYESVGSGEIGVWAGQAAQNHDAADAGSSDFVDGGAGNDLIRGGMGGDVLLGGTGDDTAYGMEGDDLLVGGEGGDTMYGDGLYWAEDELLVDQTIRSYDHRGNDTLLGGAGQDHLVGGLGEDQIFGGEGRDELYGDGDGAFVEGRNNPAWIPGQYHAADTIDGGDGNDFILGGGGSDVLLGGVGNDLISGDQYDRIQVDAQYQGNDHIEGGDGNDQLFGDGGNDVVMGGADNDILAGGDGNDVLWGGAGADRLDGGLGDDVYYFAPGDIEAGRKEVIQDEGGKDRIEFMTGVSPKDVSVRRVGAEIVLVMGDGAVVGVQGDIRTIESVAFSDGTQWSTSELVAAATRTTDLSDTVQTVLADSTVDGGGGNDQLSGDGWKDTLLGGAADDELRGNGGDDVLDGGAGNDEVFGGEGRDVVLFGRGDGRDQYFAGTAGAGQGDVLRLKAGLALSDLVLLRGGDDLIMRIVDGDEQLTVRSAFGSEPLERLEFADGRVVALADLPLASGQSQATQGDDVIYVGAGGETVDALSGQDTVQGGKGDDTLDGGAGDDSLLGNAGNDVLRDFSGRNGFYGGDGDDRISGTGNYVDAGAGNDTVDVAGAVIRLGSGDDTVILRKSDASPGRSRVIDGASNDVTRRTFRFASGISPSQVGFKSLSDEGRKDLWVTWPGSASAGVQDLRIEGFMDLQTPYRGGIRFVFEDAPETVWGFDDVFLRANSGTAGDDALRGTSGNDELRGLAGNDSIEGFAGNDVLDGGPGADTLRGGDGNDTLIAGEGSAMGSDMLYGEAGDDVLVASTSGTSRLSGGEGADTFRIGPGGRHVIVQDDAVSQDVLEFDASIAPKDVTVTHVNGAAMLVARDPVSGAIRVSVELQGLLRNAQPGGVTEVRFAGNPATVWTLENLRERALQGTAGADTLTGFDWRDDRLVGGMGNDTLAGGLGDDVYLVGKGEGRDVITETSGTDTLRFGAGIAAADVKLVRTSSPPTDLTGRTTAFAAADSLVAVLPGGGQVWIPGFFSAGGGIEGIEFADGARWSLQDIQSRTADARGTANAMQGTAGDDTFTVDHVADTIAEGSGQGTDTVNSSVSYVLPGEVENLTLTGSLDIAGVGNAAANVITGNAGNNVLNGMGGVDRLMGGAGDDIYVDAAGGAYDNNKDVIVERAGEGKDTLLLDAKNRVLDENVENLVLIDWSNSNRVTPLDSYYGFQPSYQLYDGRADDTRLQLSGNTGDNTIDATNQGRLGATLMGDRSKTFGGIVLDGGLGNDTLIGGAEDDYYVLDSLGDKVVETGIADNGAQLSLDDTVVSSRISIDLPLHVENIELLGDQAINATGNDQANQIRASRNTARNVLTGKGGDDTYYVGIDDAVVEQAGGGTDRVIIDVMAIGAAAYHSSGKVFRLDDYANVEKLAANGQLRGNQPAQGVHLVGNAGNNTVSGSFQDDIVEGGAGDDVVEDQYAAIRPNASLYSSGWDNDELLGGAGDDRLVSYAGRDVMDGGTGNDTLVGGDVFRFGRGDGQDVITAWTGRASADRQQALRFKTGVVASDVSVRRVGDTLVVAIRGTTDQVTVQGFYGDQEFNAVRSIEFADGTAWGFDALMRMTDPNTVNHAPVLSATLPEAKAATNTPFSFTLSAGAFKDEDAGEVLTYSATLADGKPLPGWLAFDAPRLSFSGTPAAADQGALSVRVTATDAMGAQASGSFALNIAAGNRPPVAGAAIAQQRATEDAEWRFTVPAGTFTDADAGDVLTWTAQHFGGGPLPDWLSFDAATRTFHGTPTGNDGGTLGVALVVTDRAAASARLGFDVWVETVNDAPVAKTPLTAQSFKQGAAWSFALPADAFVDEDEGDVLTYSATLSSGAALPAWLTFDAAKKTLRSSSTSAPAGTYEITITGTDEAGAKASQKLPLTVQSGTITGTASNDTLTGTSGNDTLDGGAGADTMTGLGGDDTYVVDNASDKVVEAANAGADTVLSSVTYTLTANVENLTLTGTAAISGTGNALANALVGNAGANRLDGGSGADAMTGGAGNDVYVVDNAGDTVTEAANGGTDAVESSITHALAANVENLTLTGTAAINGTGNALNNTLTGNSGANRLDGGSGADAMTGGAGNDVYVVDNAGDTVIEAANGGTDAVESSITHTLAANVENLTLTGTAAINGTGNALANTLAGNSGANRLDGGAGADAMSGGAGDDVYMVDNASDTVTEGANGGTDTVESSIAYTLGSDVENLTLTGSSALNGTGNALNNRLLGNAGANTLTGGAGADYLDGAAGADTLIGGLGNDTYWLGRGYGLDTIQENDSTSGNQDIAKFGSDISSRQLWFRKSGNHLEVSVIGTNDKFTVSDWYSGTKNQVERFDAGDGKSLTNSQVQNLVQAMASFSPPAAGQTTLPANYQSGLESVLAANWK